MESYLDDRETVDDSGRSDIERAAKKVILGFVVLAMLSSFRVAYAVAECFGFVLVCDR